MQKNLVAASNAVPHRGAKVERWEAFKTQRHLQAIISGERAGLAPEKRDFQTIRPVDNLCAHRFLSPAGSAILLRELKSESILAVTTSKSRILGRLSRDANNVIHASPRAAPWAKS